MLLKILPVLVAAAGAVSAQATDLPPLPPSYSASGLPPGPPQPAPTYMVDNSGNSHNAAPDKGTLDDPIISDDEVESFLRRQEPSRARRGVPISETFDYSPLTAKAPPEEEVYGPRREPRQNADYWYEGVEHGQMPLAPDGYQFFRNVKDFGAVGDGRTDDTQAINRAASWFSQTNDEERCGKDCGQTTTLGAVVYFPPGEYLVSFPIIQYYYTAFIGHAANRPTIKGTANFTGIALIDCDPYIPDGDGANWYINQNQFFRQIRNFRLDLTAMNRTNWDHDQEYVPTGIHWQVSQAASLQHIDFEMPVGDERGPTTAVGIFMENGSGGFLSDLKFRGGNIGFRAGSQQYTARNLEFTSCLTAISMIWDWGFTWQNIKVLSCWVAIDCTSVGGLHDQGTGSVTVLDSHFNGVPYAITLRNGGPVPNLILDNLLVENSASVVLVSGGETIFPGSVGQIYFRSWGSGLRCDKRANCRWETGFITPEIQKPASLLDGSGNIFARPKPTYTNFGASSFIVATDRGIRNDGTGDQTSAINSMLRDAASANRPVFFPHGHYLVRGTVFIPVGSIIVGELWSQITGTGSFFQDVDNPRPIVRVGNPGDSGVVEISDMLWTVRGPTPGAIVMEWNVHERAKGSAAMWDSHFRIGGSAGSELTIAECPKTTSLVDENCMAAELLLHITPRSSGYFENVWIWTADHDMDIPHVYQEDGNSTDAVQINIYTGRGTLIESKGPTWLYGTGSEHHTLYQYGFYDARNVFLTHIQTESPYFQARPDASQPYPPGKWSSDPKFGDCERGSTCMKSWALRIINSQDILTYSSGLYSFYEAYAQDCLSDESCQTNLVETSYSEGIWMFNTFTKGASQIFTPRGGWPPLLTSSTNQTGFTSEVSVWIPLGMEGGDLGGTGGDSESGSGEVFIDSIIYLTQTPTVQCFPPCLLIFPPSTMSTSSVFRGTTITTDLTIGTSTITRIVVSEITTTVISFSNQEVSSIDTSFTFNLETNIRPPPITTTVGTITSTIILPPISIPSTTTSSVPSLTTTVLTISGTTQTWSMDQITTLSSNLVQTTSTSTRNDTVFPIWINTGGFYWSPVNPTPRPGPTPGPPPPPPPPPPPLPPAIRFPPVPNPPCFRIGGIFSIMCPPDKGNPTTHFTSGAPRPTCTAGCGTVDRGDDPEDEPESTSTCITATSTDCHTNCRNDPCQTICNTYVGCECATRTVTDFWVSCSHTSCTTTRSQTMTGCYVSGTATTTGDYCPLATFNPDDSQGYDGTFSRGRHPLATRGPVTQPTRVSYDGTTFTPTSGHIWSSPSWISVPESWAGSTTVISGSTFSLVPPTTTTGWVVTETGYTRPTSDRPPPPSRTTTTTSTTTTAAGNPSPTAWLRVAYARVDDDPFFESWENRWLWYSGRTGVSVSVCRYDASTSTPGNSDSDNHGYPPSRSVTLSGQSGCRYEGNNNGPGTLSCSGWNEPVRCATDARDFTNGIFCPKPNDPDSTQTIIARWIVICRYGTNGNSRLADWEEPEDLATQELPDVASLEELIELDESFATMSLSLETEAPSALAMGA